MNKKLLAIIIIIILVFSILIIIRETQKKLEYREILVGFEELPTSILFSIVEKYDAIVLEINEKIDTVLVKVQKGNEQTFIDKILAESKVEYAEINDDVHAFYTPNDPKWSEQWGPERIKCPDSWNIETGKDSVKIAIVDTGIDYNHEDLLGNYILGGYDHVNNDNDPMDDNGHGTHCAGIAAAVMDNNKGIAGVAQVKIMAEKVLDNWGSGSFYEVADGIVHAVDNDADIISMSLGSSSPSSTIEDACSYAWNNDVIIVAASGNDYSNKVSYPAAYDTVIAVGALDQSNKRTTWSNYGEKLELMAPGDKILSTIPNNDYDLYSGTSMACPHVAGVAGLALSRHPGYTNQEIRNLLVDTADDLGSIGWDKEYGHGRVDATFDDEVITTQPSVNIHIHRLTRIDPIDPLDAKPEWYYKIAVKSSDGNTELEYNYNGEDKKIMFWWRFIWTSEYTWDVDENHSLNASTPIVTIEIKLMDHDPLSFDDVADLSSNTTRKIALFKYDMKNNKILEDESDDTELDNNWYVTNGELDGSTNIDENDAKLWFKISDNYEPLIVELEEQYYGRKNEQITLTSSASKGLTPYNYSWDIDNDGNYDDTYGKTIKWSWQNTGTYKIGLKVTDNFNQSTIKTTTVYIDDTPPTVEITKPMNNSLYIFNMRTHIPLLRTWIIGAITIEIDVIDNIGVDKIKLYIDDELKTNLTKKPYTWRWDEKTPLRFKHTLKAVAYDKAGNSATSEITVWKLS